MKKKLFIMAAVVLALAGCNPSGKKKDPGQQAEPKPLNVMPFLGDSAYRFVAEQVAFGPRVVNSKAHARCAEYLTAKLSSYTSQVTVQQGTAAAFDGTALKFKNIIASFGPKGKNRILLCAHWDSRPFADYDPDPANHRKPIDGANDGASGVGVLLEIARQMSLAPPQVGVDIILFDAEDYGPPQDEHVNEDTQHFWAIGSQHWARQPHVQGYTATFGILLDMVGARNATFLIEGFSADYASGIVSKVWNNAASLGYGKYFINERAGYINDDHLPINRDLQIPTIDIIHLDQTTPTGFYPYWHTIGDQLDKIDPNTLEVVGKTVMSVIYNP